MTLAIIDGDILLYLGMWGCDNLEESKEKFHSIHQEILEETFATSSVMAFGSPTNFRKQFYPDYKASKSRVKTKDSRPNWFYELKEWAASWMESTVCNGYEADDQVRIWASEADKANIQRIVVSVDKDLDCITGLHYNPRRRQIYELTQEQADFNYWKQLLMGDSTDNIPGIEGIGTKKAEAILKENKEFKNAVCIEYCSKYGYTEGYYNMLANGRLLHIWRDYEDHFKLGIDRYDSGVRSLEFQ